VSSNRLSDLACRVYQVGKSRVKINPDCVKFKTSEVTSRAGLRHAVLTGDVVILPKGGVSRHKTEKLVVSPKTIRMQRVRRLRALLKSTREKTLQAGLSSKSYHRIYKAISLGILMSKAKLLRAVAQKTE
jgi:ribosomal protein L19E